MVVPSVARLLLVTVVLSSSMVYSDSSAGSTANLQSLHNPRLDRSIGESLTLSKLLHLRSSVVGTRPCDGIDAADIVVFSGGTAWNSIANVLSREGFRCAYILPVSDDGGSTSEIRRVLGGPAIGDIRSRLSRVETKSPSTSAIAMQQLVRLRLNEDSEAHACAEWREILTTDHRIWGTLEHEWMPAALGLLRLLHSHLFSSTHGPSHLVMEQRSQDEGEERGARAESGRGGGSGETVCSGVRRKKKGEAGGRWGEGRMRLANASVGNLLLVEI